MALVLDTAPQAEPLSLQEAKDHLREDLSHQDALITSLITSARQHVETFTRRALITQTWKLYLDGFPEVIRLPRVPVQSVTSVEYEDVAGSTQTVPTSDYRQDLQSEPARITEADGKSWPLENDVTNAVIVTFVAGYGDSSDDVPEPIKSAMKLLIGHWYHNREAVNVGNIVSEYPMAVDSLLWPYRILNL